MCRGVQHGELFDETLIGVLAHEVGHHVSSQLGRSFVKEFEKLGRWHHGKDSLRERAAEAIRLYMLNPTLLLRISPQQYYAVHNRLVVRSNAALGDTCHPVHRKASGSASTRDRIVRGP